MPRPNGKLLFTILLGVVSLGAIGLAVTTSTSQDWHPIGLVALLLALSVLGDRFTITIGNQNLSAAFIAFVLAMALLGPAPAVAAGVAVVVVDTFFRRPPVAAVLTNLAAYAAFLLGGALLIRLLAGDVHDPGNHGVRTATFALYVFGVFLTTNTVNFAFIATYHRIFFKGRSFVRQVKGLYWPMLPGQVAAAALAAILAVAYTTLGYPVLVGLVLVILIFQYLAMALLRSEERADQLEARTVRLASLQLGVLVTLVETLALRDRSAARHAAAVARYSRDLAREAGCSEEDQDMAHTAGLLHDIGKFALPDRVLHASELSPHDRELVKRHPQEGATLVGRLDGYGPVADAILYHHERIDGIGYPAALIGNEIPQLSRILAVANAYDHLTARDAARSNGGEHDAASELRRMAGHELDSELVEQFLALLERQGLSGAGASEADFEAELAFERRARTIAEPALRGAA